MVVIAISANRRHRQRTPRVCSVSTLGVPGAKFHWSLALTSHSQPRSEKFHRLLIDVIIYHLRHSLIDYLIPGRALQ
jgi:hypothetical protein